MGAEEQVAPVEVLDGDHVGRVLDEALEHPLRAPPGRDVEHDQRGALHPAVRPHDRAGVELGLDVGAVLASREALAADRLARLQGADDLGQQVALLVGDQDRHRPADDLVRAPAVQALGGRAEEQDVALAVDADDRLLGGVDDRAQRRDVGLGRLPRRSHLGPPPTMPCTAPSPSRSGETTTSAGNAVPSPRSIRLGIVARSSSPATIRRTDSRRGRLVGRRLDHRVDAVAAQDLAFAHAEERSRRPR